MSAKKKRPTSRIWPVQEKRRLVEEVLLPGASVAEVARRNNVNANLLFRWRSEYRRGDYGPASPEPKGPNFVPVGVIGDDGRIVRNGSSTVNVRSSMIDVPLQIESARCKADQPLPAQRLVHLVDLELPNKARLTFDANMDEAVFRRLIAMVKDAT
jgi:transposase-like protein